MTLTDVVARPLDTRHREQLTAGLTCTGDLRFIALTDVEGTAPEGMTPVKRRPVSVPPASWFGAARAIAERVVDDLHVTYPPLVDGVLPDTSLRDFFVAAATLRLGIEELPRVASYLAQHPYFQHWVLVNTETGPNEVNTLARLIGRRFPGRRPRPATTVSTSVFAKHAGLLEGIDAPPLPPTPRGGVVALVGSEAEVGKLQAFVDAVEGPVVVVPKNDRAESRAAAHRLADLARGTLLDALTSNRVLASAPSRERTAALLRQLGPVMHEDPSRRALLVNRAAATLSTVRQVLALDAVIAVTGPRLIVGALDRTAIGALLPDLAHNVGAKVVDFQHGSLTRSEILDLMPFDLVAAWNERSRTTMIDEGFPRPDRVVVVGNPAWNAGTVDGDRPAPLAGWAGDDDVVLFLPQPAKGPYLTDSTIRRVTHGVVQAVRERPHTKLLVRERPRAIPDAWPRDILDVLSDRCRIVDAADVPLARALNIADVAVSIYSTALADALHAGIPAVAFDPDRVVPGLGLDFTPALEITHDEESLRAALDDALGRRKIDPSRWPDVFPQFDAAYHDRIVAVLDERRLSL